MPAEQTTPRFIVEVDGQEMTQADPRGLESMIVEDHVDMIGMAELTIAMDEGVDVSSFEIGKDVSIKVGMESSPIFVGKIAELRHTFENGRSSVVLVAFDPLHQLASSRATAVFEEVTDSDIANRVLETAGVEIGTIDTTSETIPYTLQRDESHYVFLRRLAARNGFHLLAREGKIDFVKPQYSGSFTEIPKEELVMMDYRISPVRLPQEITVRHWDYLTKSQVEGTASSSDIDTIGSGTNAVSSSSVWDSSSPTLISDVMVSTQSGAREMARAELNRLSLGYLRGRAVTEGNGALRVDSLVKLAGHRSGFNASVYVLSSKHQVFVGSAYTTAITFCSNTEPGD
ncbi:MAG TPA: phage late control D family protein [Deltaproteobacteria bacterium]|nr:phage late control D family protein [Deltaproteobacteria bacterium]